MRKLTHAVLLCALLLYPADGSAQLLINEVEANTLGDPDLAEFVELRNVGSTSIDLSDYVLVLYNGSTDLSYGAFDLSGSLAPGDYYVIAGSAAQVANTDLDVSPDTHLIQNGADAVALYSGLSASSFPNDTPLSTANLADAVVYGIADPDDVELLVLLLAGQPQVDEELNGSSALESMQRCGGGARVTSSFEVATPTPGVANNCSSVCGDSAIEGAEQCDDGAANGTAASCCTSSCRYEPADSACSAGGSGGACDVTSDRCNAVGECIDRVRRSGFVCRAASGICDVAEVCDGSSPLCPEDSFLSGGDACRPADGACDVAEFCDGAGADCPADGFLLAGSTCRSEGGLCNPGETCSGSGPDCPADALLPDGTDCDSAGLVCDGPATCLSGVCTAGAAPVCDDLDPCTADLCAEPGGCDRTPIPGCCTTSDDCDDRNPCTEDNCRAGGCAHDLIPGCSFDAGALAPDAGLLGTDGSAVLRDAGPDAEAPEAGGCACRAHAGDPHSRATLWALLLAPLLLWRRRR